MYLFIYISLLIYLFFKASAKFRWVQFPAANQEDKGLLGIKRGYTSFLPALPEQQGQQEVNGKNVLQLNSQELKPGYYSVYN